MECAKISGGIIYKSWLAPYRICNGRPECMNEEDENESCKETANKTKCIGGSTKNNAEMFISENQKCYRPDNEFKICLDGKDQLNCTDNVTLMCEVNGHTTSVTDLGLCIGPDYGPNCDDGIDNNCLTLGPQCKVHKHMTCDGDAHHCGNGVDENKWRCNGMTERFTCHRRVFKPYRRRILPQSIPIEWACDGIQDCIDGSDEDREIWRVCLEGSNYEHFVEKHKECRDVFICESQFVKLQDLCRNKDICESERKVCDNIAQNKRGFLTQATKFKKQKVLGHCVPGINLQKDTRHPELSCNTTTVSMYEEAYGTIPASLIHPAKPQSCRSYYGELYVYLSCLGLCLDAQCPLQKIEHDSCSIERIKPELFYTLTKNNTLTIAKRLGRGRYTNEIFSCKNKRCIPYDKVCNLHDDCGDSSDEENCTNHFFCKSDDRNISMALKCNGRFDCADGQDECNEECGAQIINSTFLKTSAWIQGILATLFNIIVAVNHLVQLKGKLSNRTSLTVALLVILVSIGDMFVGIYLIILATYDSIEGERYCISRFTWLKSGLCTFLGVINCIGTQLALFSMVYISIFRAWVMKTRSISSRPADWRYLLVLASTIFAFIIFPSLAFSLAPLLPPYQDYFMNGVYYGKDNILFKGAVNKEEHIMTLQSYYGRFLGAHEVDLSWQEIRKLVNSMFTDSYGGIKGDNIGFFGNEGVCLFKYFVEKGDPKSGFTWSLLIVNFCCFVVIACCYTYINYINLSSAGTTNTDKSRKAARDIQRRISVIILTDFLCWVPCIIVCLLHYLGAINASHFYPYFSIMILPINSLVNPLIYDNTVPNLLMSVLLVPYKKIKEWVQQFRTEDRSCNEQRGCQLGLNAMVKSTVTVATMIETELND